MIDIASMPMPRVTATTKGAIEHIDRGQGRAVLSLHGGMGGYDQSWLLARALFADLFGIRVIAVSRPGYLGTKLAVGETAERQADAFAALLDTLKVERTIVAAVSAGGPSALQFALRHPDRCAGLILVSTATGKLDIRPEIKSRMRLMGLLAGIPGVPSLLRRGVLRNPHAAASRAIRDQVTRIRTLADPEAASLLMSLQAGVMMRLRARLPGTMNDTRRFEALPDFPFEKIAVPTLVIHGAADAVVPVAHGRAAASRISGAEMLEIAGGEHVALFTDLGPIRSAAAVFLEKTAR